MGLGEGSFPVAERAGERVMSLPNYPEMTEEMLRYGWEGERVGIVKNSRKAAEVSV